jgi:hypothetical protein
MNTRSLFQISPFLFIGVALLIGCGAPDGDSQGSPSDDAVEVAVDEATATSLPQGWRRSKRWSWWYREAVAKAKATAEDGGTATAVATAFADSIKSNGKEDEPCAFNAIATATAVAEVSCNGAQTVATAVASVLQC